MYEIIRESLASSLGSYQKIDNINIMLADIFARYIALCIIYKDRRSCERALAEVLASSDTDSLHKVLHKEGFLDIAAKVDGFLAAESFDAEQAKHLFDADALSYKSYKAILQKISFAAKKEKQSKSRRLSLFVHVLKALQKSHSDKSKAYKTAATKAEYSTDDMQCLLNLISSMIPRYLNHYQDIKDSVAYNARVKSFGQRLSAIVTKNNTSSGESDHKILLAIIHEFKKYGFVLGHKFEAAVAACSSDFAAQHDFLLQGRLKILLFDLDMKLNNDQLEGMPVTQALQIITAINRALDSATAKDDDLEEVTLIDAGDITEDISRQVDLFIKCFHKIENKSLQESAKDMALQGLYFIKSISQKSFIACRYLMVAMDISLISLSLVAGTSVFMANGILILSFLSVTLLAFVSADCYKDLCHIDQVSAKLYDSCAYFYARAFSKVTKEREFVVDPEGHISFDSSLIIDEQGGRSDHSGLVISRDAESPVDVVELNPTSKSVN